MSRLTVRFFHHPTCAPLVELAMEGHASLGSLKTAAMEWLAKEEDCFIRVFDKWYLEISLGEHKRLLELTAKDEGESIDSLGIQDCSSIFLEGPTVDTKEGLGQALAITSLQCRRSQTEQSAVQTHLVSLLGRLVDMQQTLAEGQKEIAASLKQLSHLYTSKEVRNELQDAVFLATNKIKSEEAEAFQKIHTEYNRKHVLAAEALARFDNMPAKALWFVLNNTVIKGPEVALSIILSINCGLELRSKEEEGDFTGRTFKVGYGCTPLLLAAHANRLDVARALVALGADVNVAETKWKSHSLHSAASHNNVELIKLLLDKGADVNFQSRNNDTPLHWAASFARLQAIEVLLASGANVKAETTKGATPMMRFEGDGRKKNCSAAECERITMLLTATT